MEYEKETKVSEEKVNELTKLSVSTQKEKQKMSLPKQKNSLPNLYQSIRFQLAGNVKYFGRKSSKKAKRILS